MLWRIALTGLALLLALCVPFYPAPARADLAVGQRFPQLRFSGAMSAADRVYLGLKRTGEFTLADIKAPYVLIEIFSDTCPHCMLQAPVANHIFRLMEQDPKFEGAPLKMMGVGFYGTAAAMEKWKAKYQVPFPLIPDPLAQVGKALDIPGTPTYVVLDKQGRVIYVFAGEIDSPKKFLREVLARLKF